jgi:D-serine deaminase-like pyridoxal phosphate-dependent protein
MSGLMGAVGRTKQELDTPALVVDLPTMERNIVRMTERILGHGVHWRPHTKGQKVPAIAHRLIRAGAIGVTCAKLGEAEVMAAAGIQDILIANQIVGPEKIARLVNLRQQCDVIVAVDSAENVAELSAAASAKGVELRVVVEVDVGMHRCGVPTPDAAVALARQVADSPGLKFAGVEGWEAPCTGVKDPAEKRACVEQAIALLLDAARRCRAAGLPVEIVSCGGTGTYWITATIPGVTEIQAGGGIFCDVLYQENYGLDHELALTMMTTVISRPAPTRIIVDAGKKTYSSDGAIPRALGVEGVISTGLSAEHTKLELSVPNTSLKVGDRLEFVVGYSDTTMHLHDELFGVRDNVVETAWPILGRGKLR